MRKILSVILCFFTFNLSLCSSIKQNIQQTQLKKLKHTDRNSLLNRLASYFLFFGTKDDTKHIKNLNNKFKIKN